MRLASFHIDGFGALADFGEDEIAPGLVVVLGPNEAGKSTIFDFLTGVLFGFPNRRDNPRFRSPVRGGRHGGRVGFVDDAGGRWVVERHAGTHRDLVVRSPDGSEGDERSLSRALAGASSALFEAVFAVGLDDLGQMRNLESDEVRELLFAASIFGQRRSATKAMKHLGDARDELARPRREEATANRLAAELERVRADMAGARKEAGRYGALQHQGSQVEDELRRMRAQLKALRDRERELVLLESCWQHHRRVLTAREELASIPPIGAALSVMENGDFLREVVSERSGHFERVEKLEELMRSRASIEASIERRLLRMGQGWTRQRATEAPAPEVLSESVRASRDSLSTLRTEAASRLAVLAEAEGILASLPEGDDLADAVPERAELQYRETAVSELRERLGEVERLQVEALADERELALDLLEHAAHSRDSHPLILALFGGGLAVCALGAALFAGDHGALAILAILVGALLLAAGAFLWAADRRHRTSVRARSLDRQIEPGPAEPSQSGHGHPISGPPGPGGGVPGRAIRDRAAADRAAMLARALGRVDELARQLELPVPPSRVDLDRYAATLQRQLERRRQLDDRLASRTEAEARRSIASGKVQGAERALLGEQSTYESWCATHGFDPTGQPDATIEAIAELAEVRAQLLALGRVDIAISEIAPAVASFDQRCKRLFDAIDPIVIDGSDLDGSRTDSATLEAKLAALVALLDATTRVEARRTSLEGDLAAGESALESALGDGESSGRLRSLLATGDVISWSSERAELGQAIDELRQGEEDVVRQHQSLAEEMRRLAASDRIAELERRQDALEVELDATLRRYLVLGAARALLQRTLAKHERERQPAVVASAAAHFERVTLGRYVGLLADAAVDGRQSFRVFSAAGEVVDAASLSRGTVEQLYLCLRLGLADSFAERSVSLPIVLDDVLVNFDPERAQAVASELAESSRSHQILLLTCHPHLAEMMVQATRHLPMEAQLIRLGRLADGKDYGERAAFAALTDAALTDAADTGDRADRRVSPGGGANEGGAGSETAAAKAQNGVRQYGGLSLPNMRAAKGTEPGVI